MKTNEIQNLDKENIWLKIEDMEKIYGISRHIQGRLRMKKNQILEKIHFHSAKLADKFSIGRIK